MTKQNQFVRFNFFNHQNKIVIDANGHTHRQGEKMVLLYHVKRGGNLFSVNKVY